MLACLLERPSVPLHKHAEAALPDRSSDERWSVVSSAKDIVSSCLQRKLKETSDDTPLPDLVDRLSFCWVVLRKADGLIRKQKKGTIPLTPSLRYVTGLLNGVLPASDDTELQPPVAKSICKLLMLDEDAGFLNVYHEFLKSAKRHRISLNLVDNSGKGLMSNVNRLVWWIIRHCDGQYILPQKDGHPRRHFAYLVRFVRDRLEQLSDPRVLAISGINGIIEDQINLWMNYCCLDGDDAPSDLPLENEIAQAFIKCNPFKTRIFEQEAAGDPVAERRMRELEAEISQYAQQARAYESEIRQLTSSVEKQGVQLSQPTQHDSLAASEVRASGLLEVLKQVDAKYSLEVLDTVQFGEDSAITLKNFVRHVFRALRRAGLVAYPERKELDLEYEMTGMYDCVGFQLYPDQKKRVFVMQRGWALSCQDRLLPIRKAQVQLRE